MKLNGAAKRINYEGAKATPPENVTWPWVRKELTKDALHIKATLDLLDQLRFGPDWSAEDELNSAVRLWLFTYSATELFARADPDADTRKRFLNLMKERRAAMNEILAKAGARTRIPEPEETEFVGHCRGLHVEEF